MQLSINQSERFKADYEKFKSAIDKIEDTKQKTELGQLLSQLVDEVNSIDKFYDGMLSGKGMPSRVADARSSITTIRKELERRLSFHR